jgi:uncharacterized protein (DUF849 family)
VLIKACLNGGRTRDEHPAVPITAEDVAADAARVAEAGAGAVHVHARDHRGAETLDPAACAEVVAGVNATAPGLPVGLTTAAWIAPNPERLRLIERWDPPPDFASVNVREDGSGDLCLLLRERGIGVEAGVVIADDVALLPALGSLWLRVLVEVDEELDGERAASAAASLDVVLDEAGIDAPRLHHAYGIATWDVIRAAVAKGRDVRIGLEDTLVLADGSPAPDNAGLVAAAMELTRAAS